MKRGIVFGMMLCMVLSGVAYSQDEFYFTTQEEVNNFAATEVNGSLVLAGPDITDLTPLSGLVRVTGDFYIHWCGVKSLAGLENLVSVNSLHVQFNDSLLTLDGLYGLKSATHVDIFRNSNLVEISGINRLPELFNLAIYLNPLLRSISGLNELGTITNSLILNSNPELADISGLGSLTSVKGMLITDNGSFGPCCLLYYPIVNSSYATIANNGLSGCTREEILATGHCGDNFTVGLQFKDRTGAPVGDVIVRVPAPPYETWKVISGWKWETLRDGTVCNALYRGRLIYPAGTYRFEFAAPEGWQFVNENYLEITVADANGIWSTAGHEFLLERVGGASAPAEEPEEVCPVENTGINALAFVKGSPSWGSEPWCNAVDGDFDGWDGTATVLPDASGLAWAIFRFASDDKELVHKVGLHVTNGEENEQPERHVTRFEVLISQTGTEPADFLSAGIFKLNTPVLSWFNLQAPSMAKYIMLKVLAPAWTPRNYKQVVEFCVNDALMDLPAKPAFQRADAAAMPDGTALTGSYPNPFNPETTISYRLSASCQVSLRIYNLSGQLVATLTDAEQPAGNYSVRWSGAAQPSGIYFCHLQAGTFSARQQLVLVK